MAVNGVEIKVGQKWRKRNGVVRTITSKKEGSKYPWQDDQNVAYTDEGRYMAQAEGKFDLEELVEDAPPAEDPAPAPVPQAVELAAFPDIPETERVTAALSSAKVKPVDAPDLLDAAAGHMRDRAATYDKPEGERSIAQVVTAFNAIHGTAMTEVQGWHFMCLLKQVRAFSAPGKVHRDSLEDNIAYSALMGEAMLKGGAQ